MYRWSTEEILSNDADRWFNVDLELRKTKEFHQRTFLAFCLLIEINVFIDDHLNLFVSSTDSSCCFHLTLKPFDESNPVSSNINKVGSQSDVNTWKCFAYFLMKIKNFSFVSLRWSIIFTWRRNDWTFRDIGDFHFDFHRNYRMKFLFTMISRRFKIQVQQFFIWIHSKVIFDELTNRSFFVVYFFVQSVQNLTFQWWNFDFYPKVDHRIEAEGMNQIGRFMEKRHLLSTTAEFDLQLV